MNTHELARLLLSVPAQSLKDEGANERYNVRLSLKGVKLPGIASIGGWVYPETEVAPAKVAAPTPPVKRTKTQKNTPPATVAPTPAAPSAPPAIPGLDLSALTASITQSVLASLKASKASK